RVRGYDPPVAKVGSAFTDRSLWSCPDRSIIASLAGAGAARAQGTGGRARGQATGGQARAQTAERRLDARHVDVEHRRDVEREELRHQETAHDGQAEGAAGGPAGPGPPRARAGAGAAGRAAPAPTPSGIGRVPKSAAIVVIMIGRKRSRQPL